MLFRSRDRPTQNIGRVGGLVVLAERVRAVNQIAEHWPLITALLGAGGAALGIWAAARRVLRSEVVDTVIVAMENGLGDRVRELVRLGVMDALRLHQIDCPVRERVDEHTDAIKRIHARVDEVMRGER